MERDSLQDKDDLKLKIKQSIKAWAHIFLSATYKPVLSPESLKSPFKGYQK